jgi:hypothetical protein
VYWQWHTLIKVSIYATAAFSPEYLQQDLLTCSQEAEAALRSAGVYDTENFSSAGVAGIFALYANPKAPLGEVFLNEFVSVRGRVHIADHD